MPIFLELINKINIDNNFIFHFPSVSSKKKLINDFLLESGINNYVITTTEEEKNFYIRNSILAISKSGTITLDICKNKCPLIVIYKTSFINFLLIKPFINTKFGNILNIIANKEIIPELIQNNCNIDSIYKKAHEFINDEALRKKQVRNYTEALKLIIVKDSLDKISNYVLE
jgi:lipid-A-disaccharide synthase